MGAEVGVEVQAEAEAEVEADVGAEAEVEADVGAEAEVEAEMGGYVEVEAEAPVRPTAPAPGRAWRGDPTRRSRRASPTGGCQRTAASLPSAACPRPCCAQRPWRLARWPRCARRECRRPHRCLIPSQPASTASGCAARAPLDLGGGRGGLLGPSWAPAKGRCAGESYIWKSRTLTSARAAPVLLEVPIW